MKISAAQTRPYKGDIGKNIETHLELIGMAIESKADAIFFPELSITGYEPSLADKLATTQEDERFDVFQKVSDSGNIIIGFGVPTRKGTQVFISEIIFQPGKPGTTYSKQYLHQKEEKYFSKGSGQVFIEKENYKIATAICYESSVPEHMKYAIGGGANIYAASVLNPVSSIERELNDLSKIAKEERITVLMSNFIGESGGYEAAGRTSVWGDDGKLAGQMDERSEGILVFDTLTKEAEIRPKTPL